MLFRSLAHHCQPQLLAAHGAGHVLKQICPIQFLVRVHHRRQVALNVSGKNTMAGIVGKIRGLQGRNLAKVIPQLLAAGGGGGR